MSDPSIRSALIKINAAGTIALINNLPDEAQERIGAELAKRVGPPPDMGMKARLDRLRASLGEENYKLIAGGPSLMEVLDKQDREFAEGILDAAASIINEELEKAKVDRRVTRQDMAGLWSALREKA